MSALIRIDRSWTATTGGRPQPIRFCSRCGQPAAEDGPRRPERLPYERVCPRCGMGLMLSCARDALPGDKAAFVIIDFQLRVSAVSEAGEKIFGSEQSTLGTQLLGLLTSPMGDDHLARIVAHATQRPCDAMVLPVRLHSAGAAEVGTMAARISTCGPPRAALVTVEPSEFGRR